jgi:hypothetical protein
VSVESRVLVASRVKRKEKEVGGLRLHVVKYIRNQKKTRPSTKTKAIYIGIKEDEQDQKILEATSNLGCAY